tara:strand:- start:23 stop:667 length:645 start_codon:yes stop_codon:yes gene_type:complete
MSKSTVPDKIDEIATLKELLNIDFYLMNKIEKYIKDYKSQYKTFDILSYFDKKSNKTVYLLYSYQEHPKRRTINCFEVIPSQYYTLYGKFIPKSNHIYVDITECEIKLHKTRKEIEDERRQIKVNINDIFIYNVRLYYYNNFNVYLSSVARNYDYKDEWCKYSVCKAVKVTNSNIYTETNKVINRKFVVASYSDCNNKDQKLIDYLNDMKLSVS